MRVVFIAPDATWRGGITHYTQQLMKALMMKECDAILISYSKLVPGMLYPGRIPEKNHQVRPDHQVLKYYSPLSVLRAMRIIKQERADLMHIQWWAPHLFPLTLWLLLLNRLTLKLPAVLTVHNVLPHEHRRLGAVAIRVLAKFSDALIVHTQENREQLERLGVPPGKINVVLMGSFSLFKREYLSRAEARLQLGITSKYMVLHFGIIRRYKRLEYLLRAVPELLRREPDTCVLLAGEFWEPLEEYQGLIRSLGIEEHVIIHPWYIPDEDVHRYFAAADVVVCAHTDFQAQSAIPAIASAFGLPVVASRELGKNLSGCVTCNPQNPEELADAILRVLHADARITPRGCERWEHVADETLQIYRHLRVA